MNKYFFVSVFLFISLSLSGQAIDKSQYIEIDTFGYLLEARQTGRNYSVKYKMNLIFSEQSATTVYFEDAAGDLFVFETNRRWNINRGQAVVVYISARNLSRGIWNDPTLDDLEIRAALSEKPWQNFILNERSYLRGWYLEDIGNGMYKEVYLE